MVSKITQFLLKCPTHCINISDNRYSRFEIDIYSVCELVRGKSRTSTLTALLLKCYSVDTAGCTVAAQKRGVGQCKMKTVEYE